MISNHSTLMNLKSRKQKISLKMLYPNVKRYPMIVPSTNPI
ncbi:hypothetical protein GcM3_193035 [Golovinomyces cichoracearum]|uniref:Uncharacterized protein n=1 Tax=Golovinomyces cichoracearum TaxID=62708 RepID=A0A420HGP5_9PEZI|nr:hypothetical protein GcM3_193035 [Golovinomyces cichoracearum]